MSIAQAPTKTRTGSTGARVETEAADESLFDALRALRKRLSQESGVPPYVVFHDGTLRAMAKSRPTSLQEFAGIGGVGQSKLAKYGNVFVELIRQHAGTAA